MNPEQAARQIKYELEKVVWPSGSGSVVFGSNGRVKIYAGSPTEEQIPAAFPFALVGIGSGVADEDQRDYINQQFTVTCAVLVAGDPMGEFAVVGGPTGDLGKSAGRGVAEVAERVRFAVQDIIGVDGSKVFISLSTTETPVNLAGKHLVTCDLTVSMWCTSQLYYAPPQQLLQSGSNWTWEGANHCRSRFDFVSYRLAYVTGATPAADYADATPVELAVTTEAVSHVSSGSRAYAIYAQYSRNGKAGEAIAGNSRGDRVGAYKAT